MYYMTPLSICIWESFFFRWHLFQLQMNFIIQDLTLSLLLSEVAQNQNESLTCRTFHCYQGFQDLQFLDSFHAYMEHYLSNSVQDGFKIRNSIRLFLVIDNQPCMVNDKTLSMLETDIRKFFDNQIRVKIR